MREIFSPETIKLWKDEEYRGLVNKYVTVEVPASEWYKEHVPDGGDWEGGSGFCAAVEVGTTTITVHWDYGMGWSWNADQEVYISVCDEHGEHRVKFHYASDQIEDAGDPGAAECLRTLGIRGATKKAGGHGEETQEENAHHSAVGND